MIWLLTLITGWQHRRACFHHDRQTGESWIRSRLVDTGKAKHFWCTKCGRYWT